MATTVDNKEYIELDSKIHHIVNKFEKYLNRYITYKKSNVYDSNMESIYKFSTLQYYHKELDI